MIKGVDVSSHQGPGFKPASDVEFCIIKSSEGRTYVNEYLADQIKAARAAGCVIGFYHYLRHEDPVAQARWFVSGTPLQDAAFACCDFEKADVTAADKNLFCDEVKRLLPDIKLLVYTYPDFWKRLGDGKVYDGMWYAAYQDTLPKIDVPILIWQHTDKPIDQNIAYFDSKAEMLGWVLGVNPKPPVEPPEENPAMARVTFEGARTTKRTEAMLVEARRLQKFARQIMQGGYNAGGVAASAGTHDRDAIDLSVAGLSTTDINELVTAHRQVGFAAWHRTEIPGLWGPHCHMVPIGGDLSAGAASQVRAYLNKRDGLRGNLRDTDPGWTNTTWERYKAGIGAGSTAGAGTGTTTGDRMHPRVKDGYTGSQPLPVGKWVKLKTSKKGGYSLQGQGPDGYDGIVYLYATGLPAGHVVQVRVVNENVGTTSGRVISRLASEPVVEIIGSSGTTFSTVPFQVDTKKPGSGCYSRVQVEALTYDTAVTVTNCTVTYRREDNIS